MPKTTRLRSVSEIHKELQTIELALAQERCKPECSFYLIDEFKHRMYALRDELQRDALRDELQRDELRELRR